MANTPPDTPPSSPVAAPAAYDGVATPPSSPVAAQRPPMGATPPSSPVARPTRSVVDTPPSSPVAAQRPAIGAVDTPPSSPVRPHVRVVDTPPSSPMSPLVDSQQDDIGRYPPARQPPMTPPSPSSFSQPSVSVSATAEFRHQYHSGDFSASVDATPMPRYLGRYADGDISTSLSARHLPRGDLGRSEFRIQELPGSVRAAGAPSSPGGPGDSPPSSPISVDPSNRHGLPQAPLSPSSASASVQHAGPAAAVPLAEQSYSNAVVWGTNVSVAESMGVFRAFLHEFNPPGHADLGGESYYMKVLHQIQLTQQGVFNLDGNHLLECSAATRKLYMQLVHFPQVLIRILDMVIVDEFKILFPDDVDLIRIQVRPFNLKDKQAMRNLNPADIDQLVSLKGMVTRCSSVIPDLKMAFFRCTMCHSTVEVELDRGRIDEPTMCDHCHTRGSMEIMHNRCAFTDKQLVKMQETPDAIPEGETPYTVMLFAFDDLVDDVRPGDKIEVTGIYRAVPMRATIKQRVVKSVFKTYIDVVHFRRTDELMGALGGLDDGNAVDAVQQAKIDEYHRIASDPLVYENLAHSLAPSIWELDDVKKGVLCQLFGGTRKAAAVIGKKHTRSDLNVLLCGDPGTSKSQLLSYVHKLAPRGIYTSGKGSSAVGLTASVIRDMETGDLVLESGALVLSDEGICCIDEFDKMSDNARSVLHEVMEQQTVSIAKAGIICSLNARSSILASANPIESRYNPNKSVIENINILPTLLSRFDLIYLILDRPNAEADRQLARHIVSLYYDSYSIHNARGHMKASEVISMSVLSDYIAYAKDHVQPQLSEAAAKDLVAAYLELRRMGSNRKNITATPRQLESLIRIAEALAKMRLADTVTSRDVTEALRLMNVATQKAAMDPRTGTIDMDMITTGYATVDREALSALVDDVKRLLTEHGGGSMNTGELKKQLDSLRGSETKHTEFQTALRTLEEENLVQVSHGSVRYFSSRD
ncbi:hypothetical protein SPRG_11368 [Saprolegnia parasitica CBS 223.65]|uniref:DNA replication licensing factor MCM4 n=1 Tax=Saprolegnia parasitica (strain CBS 223.65) TaxID=695850 RepID=A0A067BZX9_SAPPC|nr:hypothetical protein SPRG_11368 [Saprolegnia parasitica CBS 223.65]KDO22415.1 hypothetical protein SPRG_11368 [Saprolegnia parasitica CBS 223.65]|eukprot:XP_012206937.1 hypothetical protein SPRG_11368 [Saprolegnia parasitica CBS 223.65]